MQAAFDKALVAFLRLVSPRTVINGIVVYSFGLGRSKRLLAVEKVDRALKLLERFDPIRLARLREDIAFIVILASMTASGAVNRATRACLLNGRLVLEDRAGMRTAVILVHEGTHLRLLKKGVSNEKYGVARIESICKRAEIQFLLRIPDFTNRESILANLRGQLAELSHSKNSRST
jgi:hypothetical protein